MTSHARVGRSEKGKYQREAVVRFCNINVGHIFIRQGIKKDLVSKAQRFVMVRTQKGEKMFIDETLQLKKRDITKRKY